MNFNTIHHNFEHGTSFLLSARGLPNKLTVGHIGQPWALGSRKKDKFAKKKIRSPHLWMSHISQSMWSVAFWIGNDAVKSFTTIFICIQIGPIFSREIPKLCFFLSYTLPLENNLYQWNYKQSRKFWACLSTILNVEYCKFYIHSDVLKPTGSHILILLSF